MVEDGEGGYLAWRDNTFTISPGDLPSVLPISGTYDSTALGFSGILDSEDGTGIPATVTASQSHTEYYRLNFKNNTSYNLTLNSFDFENCSVKVSGTANISFSLYDISSNEDSYNLPPGESVTIQPYITCTSSTSIGGANVTFTLKLNSLQIVTPFG